jgi:hypothetical protein
MANKVDVMTGFIGVSAIPKTKPQGNLPVNGMTLGDSFTNRSGEYVESTMGLTGEVEFCGVRYNLIELLQYVRQMSPIAYRCIAIMSSLVASKITINAYPGLYSDHEALQLAGKEVDENMTNFVNWYANVATNPTNVDMTTLSVPESVSGFVKTAVMHLMINGGYATNHHIYGDEPALEIRNKLRYYHRYKFGKYGLYFKGHSERVDPRYVQLVTMDGSTRGTGPMSPVVEDIVHALSLKRSFTTGSLRAANGLFDLSIDNQGLFDTWSATSPEDQALFPGGFAEFRKAIMDAGQATAEDVIAARAAGLFTHTSESTLSHTEVNFDVSGYDSQQRMHSENICTATGIPLPLIFPGSRDVSDVEIEILKATVSDYAKTICDDLQYHLNTLMSSIGEEYTVRVTFDVPTLTNVLRLAQAEQLKIKNSATMRDEGWIEQDDASRMVTGSDSVGEPTTLPSRDILPVGGPKNGGPEIK